MKPDLLLLHGALGSKNQLGAVKELLQATFTVHDLNFEGHGGIPSDSHFSMNLFSENVTNYLERCGIGSIGVFGYSMGGYVALSTALRRPDCVGKIVTLGTKFRWDADSAAKEVKMLDPEKIEAKVPHFADKLKREHHPNDWKELVRKTARMMLDLGNGKSLQANDFRKIRQEVVIGLGSEDGMVTREESEAVSKLLPNGKMVTLGGVPHPIEKIDARALADYITHAFQNAS